MASSTRYVVLPDERERPSVRAPGRIDRREFFGVLALIGFANGVSEKAAGTAQQFGLLDAALQTFGVSVFLWAGIAVSILLLVRAETSRIRKIDLVAGALALIAFAVPVAALSWLGLTLLGLHIFFTAKDDRYARKAAIVLIATTVPLFWARILFAAFSEFILRFDALLVSWFVGTRASGNVVPLADGSGSLFFAPACSSISNLSLALLCNVIFFVVYGQRNVARIVLWSLVGCTSVIAVNVVRIGLIGLHPNYYDMLHGPFGNALFGWITTFVIFGSSLMGAGKNESAFS